MDFGLSYSELITIPTFGDRLNYLSLYDKGYIAPRHNNKFYRLSPWLNFRREMLIRDLGYDLGVEGHDIEGKIILHHINPITEEDFETYNIDKLLNPENVITTSLFTHNVIHYGNRIEEVERKPGDTKLW